MKINMKTRLSMSEFLSLYTGYMFTNNFDELVNTFCEVFGRQPHIVEIPKMQEQFKEHVNETMPQFVSIYNNIGEYVEDSKMTKEEYVMLFKQAVKSNNILVDKLSETSTTKEQSTEEDFCR